MPTPLMSPHDRLSQTGMSGSRQPKVESRTCEPLGRAFLDFEKCTRFSAQRAIKGKRGAQLAAPKQNIDISTQH